MDRALLVAQGLQTILPLIKDVYDKYQANAEAERRYAERNKDREHERAMLEERNKANLEESRQKTELERQRLETEKLLRQEEIQAKLDKEQSKTKRMEEMVNAGKANIEMLKTQQENLKKEQEEYDRITKEIDEKHTLQVKALEEQNKKRNDEIVAECRQRLEEMQKENKEEKDRVEKLKQEQLELQKKAEDDLMKHQQNQLKELEDRFQKKVSQRELSNQEFQKQMAQAEDEIKKRHEKERAWLGEYKEKEFTEFTAWIQKIEKEIDKNLDDHMAKLNVLNEKLKEASELSEQLHISRLTITNTRSNQAALLQSRTIEHTSEQSYRIILDRTNDLKTKIDDLWRLKMRFKANDIFNSRDITNSKTMFDNHLNELDTLLHTGSVLLRKEIENLDQIRNFDEDKRQKAKDVLESVRDKILDDLLMHLNGVTSDNLTKEIFNQINEDLKEITKLFRSMPKPSDSLGQIVTDTLQFLNIQIEIPSHSRAQQQLTVPSNDPSTSSADPKSISDK